MQRFIFPAFLIAQSLSWNVALAETPSPLDPQIEKALEQTQATLKDPVLREKAIGNSKDAQSADNAVQQIAGNAVQSQKIYELAAQVMSDLVIQSKGDPKAMEAILENAKKNPEALANTFTPEEKKMLTEISQNIPAKLP